MNEIFSEYGSVERYGTAFGKGPNANLSISEEFRTYSGLNPFGLALIEAWLNGCPIPDEVVMIMGAEKALRRYQDCNWEYVRIKSELRFYPNLLTDLDDYVLRKTDEKDLKKLKHISTRVPGTHKHQIAPLSHFKGYGLVRAQLELGDKEKRQKVIQTSAHKSQDALQLLARTSELLINQPGVLPERILHHVLSAGNLAEEGTYHDFLKFSQIMIEDAKELWKFYLGMSPEQRINKDIIDLHTNSKGYPYFPNHS